MVSSLTTYFHLCELPCACLRPSLGYRLNGIMSRSALNLVIPHDC